MFLNVAWKLTRSQSFNGFISATVWLSVVGTALGVAVLISITSIMNGFDHDIRNKIFSITDHIKIYTSKPNVSVRKDVKKIKSIRNVIDASSFVSTPAVVIKNRVSIPISIIGLDKNQNSFPSKELSRWYKKSNPGSFMTSVTTGMENAYKIHRGDKIVTLIPSLSAPVMGMSVRSKRLPINNVIKSSMPVFDKSLIYMHLKDVQKLTGSSSMHGYKVKVENPLKVKEVSASISKKLGKDYYVESWMDNFQLFFDTLKVQKLAMIFVFSLVIVIASFSLICGLVMIVNEKRTNIAVLITMGMTPSQIRLTFLSVGLMISFTGILIGTGLGVLISYNATALCHMIEGLIGYNVMANNAFLLDYLPSKINWVDVLWIDIFAVFVSLVSIIFPAYKAAQILPAKVLRYE